jgi:hypothetical protein
MKSINDIHFDSIDYSKIYDSKNHGTFKVIKYTNSCDVEVKFTSTGCKVSTQLGHIRVGNVRDRMYPNIYGIGYSGIGKYKLNITGKYTKTYEAWFNMMRRCYCSKFQARHSTYKGCTVDSEWCNFQVFAEWYHNNYPTNGGKYELDKDIKIKGNKVYGPDTCLFVSHKDNAVKARAIHFKVVSPNGTILTGYNVSQFCRENNLSQGHLTNVINGKKKHHKGYTRYID